MKGGDQGGKGGGGEGGGAWPIKVPLLNIDQLVICDENPVVRNVLSCAKKKKPSEGCGG